MPPPPVVGKCAALASRQFKEALVPSFDPASPPVWPFNIEAASNRQDQSAPPIQNSTLSFTDTTASLVRFPARLMGHAISTNEESIPSQFYPPASTGIYPGAVPMHFLATPALVPGPTFQRAAPAAAAGTGFKPTTSPVRPKAKRRDPNAKPKRVLTEAQVAELKRRLTERKDPKGVTGIFPDHAGLIRARLIELLTSNPLGPSSLHRVLELEPTLDGTKAPSAQTPGESHFAPIVGDMPWYFANRKRVLAPSIRLQGRKWESKHGVKKGKVYNSRGSKLDVVTDIVDPLSNLEDADVNKQEDPDIAVSLAVHLDTNPATATTLISLGDDGRRYKYLARVVLDLARPKSFKEWVKSINPGLPMMVLNAITACLISLVVKELMSDPFEYASMELVFIRSVTLSVLGLAWTCGSPYLRYYMAQWKSDSAGAVPWPVIKESLGDLLFGPESARLLMFGRSLCGFLSVSGTYLALVGLNVGEATVLTFFKPIWVGILGRIILGESWENSPTSHAHAISPLVRLLSLLAGMGGSIAAAGVYVFLRKMKGQSISAMQVSTTFAVWSAILSFFGAAFMEGQIFGAFKRFPPASLWEFTLLVPLMSVMSLANQLLMNLALRYETAAKCAAMNFVQIPAGFLIDLFAYGEAPGLPDYIGGGTIVTCVLLMTLQKLKKEMEEAKRKAAAKLAEAAAKAAKKVAAASGTNLAALKTSAVSPTVAPPQIVLPADGRDDGSRQGVYITNTMVSSMVSLRGMWSPFGSRSSLQTAGQERAKSATENEDEQPLMMMRSPTPTTLAPPSPSQAIPGLAPHKP
ncbi:hypothetical protein BCR44DRAFT_1503054 [Catenaria anguillulae PL171]|uniref:EamA domain-containing protein n=1 Tax=Catenaria anguillulae PL171 TaxID=765915 RepID=A0A1Y2H9E4_9FUNG|nr:hypothetical protein BCR44DRAFT_1503054 [Catenaria anguillulae PL171]